MLTALLIICLRRLNLKYSLLEKLMKTKFSLILKGLFIFLICMILPCTINAQTKKMGFKIWRNNSCIGFIKVEQSTLNLITCYHLNSEIKVNMLINLTIVSTEKTVFENGRLSYSSVYRTVNNREKVNKRIEFLKGIYKVYNGKSCNNISLDSTSTNLASLYLNEPVYVRTIFCDNHQSVSPIINMGSSRYKIMFPDGNYNVFHYKNGSCVKVEVFNSLYRIQITPTI